MGRPVKRTAKHIPQGVDVVTRTLMLDYMNQGRWALMTDTDLLRRLPYFLYDAIIDAATTEICIHFNGTLLPGSDSFWLYNWPPNHWGCRSVVRNVSYRTYMRRGRKAAPSDVHPSGGWGMAPPVRAQAVDLLGARGKDDRLVAVALNKVRKTERSIRDLAVRVVVEKGIDPKSIDAAKRGLVNAGAFSDTKGLPKLELFQIQRQVTIFGTPANGAYSKGMKLAVTADRQIGEKYSLSNMWSVSAISRTVEGRIERTATHEFGHHIHESVERGLFGNSKTAELDISNTFARVGNKKFGGSVSAYGLTNVHEFWSESFAAYVYERSWMKSKKPDAFAMVERVLKAIGHDIR